MGEKEKHCCFLEVDLFVLTDLEEKGSIKDDSWVFSLAAGSVVVSSTTLDYCKRNEFGNGGLIKSFELFISPWFNIFVRHPSRSIKFTVDLGAWQSG